MKAVVTNVSIGCVWCMALCACAVSDEIVVRPATVSLQRPEASQQMLVTDIVFIRTDFRSNAEGHLQSGGRHNRVG